MWLTPAARHQPTTCCTEHWALFVGLYRWIDLHCSLYRTATSGAPEPGNEHSHVFIAVILEKYPKFSWVLSNTEIEHMRLVSQKLEPSEYPPRNSLLGCLFLKNKILTSAAARSLAWTILYPKCNYHKVFVEHFYDDNLFRSSSSAVFQIISTQQ